MQDSFDASEFRPKPSKPHQRSMSIKELKSIENSDDLTDWRQYNVWKAVRNEHRKTKVDEWKKTLPKSK